MTEETFDLPPVGYNPENESDETDDTGLNPPEKLPYAKRKKAELVKELENRDRREQDEKNARQATETEFLPIAAIEPAWDLVSHILTSRTGIDCTLTPAERTGLASVTVPVLNRYVGVMFQSHPELAAMVLTIGLVYTGKFQQGKTPIEIV